MFSWCRGGVISGTQGEGLALGPWAVCLE
jgi:hypothetical protein